MVKLLAKHKVYILFILILILGLLLRSREYFRGDFNYFLDQSRDLLLVRQIVESKHLALIGARSGLQGIFHGPLWLYFLVPFYLLAKGDPFWTLVPVFTLFNILLILAAFILGKKLFNNQIGLIFSLLIAISNPIIQSSFTITNAQMIMILFLFYLFFCLKYIRGDKKSVILLFFLTGLAFQFESAFAIFLIPLIIFTFIYFKKIPSLKYVLIGSALFFLTISNFLLFEARHQLLMTHSALRLFTGQIGVMRGYEQYSSLLFRVKDRLNLFINFFFFPLNNTNIIFKILTLGIVFYAAFLSKKKKELVFLLIIPLFYFVVFIFYPYPLWDQYLFGMMILSCFILALCLSKINKNITKVYLFLILIFPLLTLINQYFLRNKTNDRLGSYQSQKQVAEWVVKNNIDPKVNYFVYDSGLLTYNMDYLVPFIAKTNNKTAVSEKKDIIFLILYSPPKWNMGAQDYWIKNTIKTEGKVLETKRFKDTDIIVKKIKTEKNEPPPDQNYFQNLIFR